MRRARDADSEDAALAGRVECEFERRDRVRIFGACVNEALGSAHGDAGNRQALDQDERVAFHDHAIGESAAVALIRIAHDVLLRSFRVGGSTPLDPRWKSGAAASAQT
jgi:hypothetical protein